MEETLLNSIKEIPEKNLNKFCFDFIWLINKAKEDDYESFDIEQR